MAGAFSQPHVFLTVVCQKSRLADTETPLPEVILRKLMDILMVSNSTCSPSKPLICNIFYVIPLGICSRTCRKPTVCLLL